MVVMYDFTDYPQIIYDQITAAPVDPSAVADERGHPQNTMI